jgi:hypothetical protein
MKVAIGARLLAKGDMDVDASHGVEGTLYDHEQTEQMASKLVLYHEENMKNPSYNTPSCIHLHTS